MVQRFLLWFAVAVAVACTPQNDTSGNDSNTGAGGSYPSGPDANIAPRENYPSGPYGVTEGSIVAPLEFINSDGTPFSLEGIYADGSNRLLLMGTTAGWCSSCVEEQPELQKLHEKYSAQGLYIMVAIFEDATFQPADSELAAQWKSQYKLDFTIVADPEFVLDDYYESSLTPMTMLVEVSSMKIIKLTTGWDPSMVQAVIEARL